MGRQHRPVAAWFGDVSITGHIGRLLRTGGIDAVVTFGPAMAMTPEMDRKAVAKSLELSVRRMTAAARSGRPEIAIYPNALALSPAPVSLAAETR
jgi:1-acyl-sn-glycerol-3-phosphate acyltransferase